MTNMFPIRNQRDGSEFRLCSKNKYVNSLDSQDANLQILGKNDADSFKSDGRGSIRPHFCKDLAKTQIFQACLCGGEY